MIGSIEYLVQLFDRYRVDYRLSIGQPFFIHTIIFLVKNWPYGTCMLNHVLVV